MLKLFYAEPDPDRWAPLDRYPRRAVRRLVRGKSRPGGQKRMFLNLCAGLDRIGEAYAVNDYRGARRNPGQLACIVGKPCVLDRFEWRNPILFGAAVHSHPCDDPGLLSRRPIEMILAPGPWMADMCRPAWGNKVRPWPVGIDTLAWRPAAAPKTVDALIYDKVRWDRSAVESGLVKAVQAALRAEGRSFEVIRYGGYREPDYRAALARCRCMIFLCEHETQGIAYQEALACGTPVLAWDRGGPWLDPSYYPDKVVFGPVSSVPYWDARCGRKFTGAADFAEAWRQFWDGVQANAFSPRAYVLENLALEKCAAEYVRIAHELQP